MIQALRSVESGARYSALEHLTECQPNDNQTFRAMMQVIYKDTMEKMSEDRTSFPFSLLISCMRHLRDVNFPAVDKQLVISRLAIAYENGGELQIKKIQLEIMDLISSGYMDSEIVLLNELMSKPFFWFFWTLPCEYSLRGKVYPA